MQQIPKLQCFSSYCSCLCRIHWSQVLSREWRCSWSSADRWYSNYIWVINNVIAYYGTSYIRCFTLILGTKYCPLDSPQHIQRRSICPWDTGVSFSTISCETWLSHISKHDASFHHNSMRPQAFYHVLFDHSQCTNPIMCMCWGLGFVFVSHFFHIFYLQKMAYFTDLHVPLHIYA